MGTETDSWGAPDVTGAGGDSYPSNIYSDQGILKQCENYPTALIVSFIATL